VCSETASFRSPKTFLAHQVLILGIPGQVVLFQNGCRFWSLDIMGESSLVWDAGMLE